MEPTQFPPSGDGLAQEYAGRAQVLVDLARRVEEEEYEKAVAVGRDALKGLRGAGQPQAAPADAARLVAKSLAALGRHDEAYKVVQEELAAARSAKDQQSEARMLLATADIKWPLDEHEEALQAAEEAQALFRGRDGKMEGLALVTLSWVHATGDEDGGASRAIGCARRAHALFREAGCRPGEAQALHALASAQAAGGSLDEGLRSADEALDVYLECKSMRMAAFEWLCMSRWHVENKNPAKAVSDAEDALEVYQSLGSAREATALMAVFKAREAEGKPKKASRLVKEALARCEDSGDKRAEAAVLEVLFKVCRSSGKPREALNAAERATAIFRQLGDRSGEGRQLAAVAALHAGTGAYEKAVQAGADAVPLLKKDGSTEDKIELMKALADAYAMTQNLTAASEVVSDMHRHFQDLEDNEGCAAALMSLCSLAIAQDKLEEAVRVAGNAQVIFHEEEDTKGEADVLRLMCEIHTRKEEHKAAVRAAEQARALFRELDDVPGETAMLYMLAQSAVSLAIREGARVGENPRASRTSREALAKASKAVGAAVRQARGLQSDQQLLACALCTLSQVEMLSGRPGEALKAADEGILLFREAGDNRSEASALLLSGDALRATAQHKESQEAATEALRLFKEAEDTRGEERAQELLGFLQQFLRPAPAAQTQQAAAATPVATQQVDFSGQGGSAAPAQQTSVARQDRDRGAALDLSGGIDEAVVQAKVLEIAVRITGAEDGEIEADTPLMEAGLTSNSAILLRDELSQELPGVNLPVTLVFDYPSIAAMTELIVEASAKAIK